MPTLPCCGRTLKLTRHPYVVERPQSEPALPFQVLRSVKVCPASKRDRPPGAEFPQQHPGSCFESERRRTRRTAWLLRVPPTAMMAATSLHRSSSHVGYLNQLLPWT